MSEPTFSLGQALLLAGLFVATALAFLLAGWRLGRESAGRAMFDHPLGGTPERDTLAVEPDPWAEAMHGAPTPDPVSADARNAAI
jgi:hypothetical protein